MRNNARALLVGLAAAMAAATVAGAREEVTIPESDEIAISEAYHLWRTLGERVWPGWTESPMPMVFVSGDYDFAIGFDDVPAGFAPTPQRVADRTVGVRARELEPTTAASYPFQGIPAVVVGPPDSLGWSPAQWTITVAHEMFHVLSSRRGSVEKIRSLNIGSSDDPSWQLDFPFPYGDVNVMRLIHLEGYLIFLAMESPEKDPSVLYNAGSALEALEVNKAYLRSTTGDDKAARYAMFQESEEGAGRYTEFRMAELAAQPDYEPVRGFAALERNVSYAALWEDQYKNARFVVKHAGRGVKTRTVFYYLGAGKCLLLDRIDPDWKDSFFAPDVWLDDLMARAVGARTTLKRIEVGAASPGFELKTLDGKSHRLKDYRGQVVLLAFWQWWCPPCLVEMPHLQALLDRHRDDGLVVLGISDRVDETARAKIQKVLAKTGTSCPALIDPTGSVLRDYGVNSYPMTVLIGRDGVVRWVDSGFQTGSEDVIEQQVSTALKGGR